MRTLKLMWHALWPAGLTLAVVAGAVVLACVCGCTAAQQQKAVTVVVVAATKGLDLVNERIRAEESACLGGSPHFADAKACVQKSRAKWSPALTGADLIIAAGEGALDGDVDFASVAAAYCDMQELVPTMPQLPAVLGVCR